MRIESASRRAAPWVALLATVVSSAVHAEPRMEWLGDALPFRVNAATALGTEFVAVGGRGAFAVTEGERWRIGTLPTLAEPTAVWASPEGDLFVATSSGELLVGRSAGAFSVMQSPCRLLRAVAGRSRADVLVGGDEHCLARFDGHAFTRIELAPIASVTHIAVAGIRTLVGGTSDDGETRFVELRGSASPTSALPEGMLSVRAVEPSGARGSWIASDRVVEHDGRTFVTHYEDGPRGPRAFLRVGNAIFVTSASALHRIEGRRFVELPYRGRPLLALAVRGDVVTGVTDRGERVRIDPSGAEIRGGRIGAATWLCAAGERLLAFDEHGSYAVTRDSVRWLDASAPAAPCARPRDDAGLSARFVRGDETFMFGEQAEGLAFLRVRGGETRVLADPWAVARFPSVVSRVGGSASADAPVFAVGRGFAVRFAEGRMHRHLFGAAQADLEPHGIREASGAVFVFGRGNDVMRWDGNHFRREATVAADVIDVAAAEARTLALGRGDAAAGSPDSLSASFDDSVLAFDDDSGSDAFDGRVLVRRDAGYFASLASENDLVSGLLGDELGPVRTVFGASPRDVWVDSRLGLARYDGTRWARESTVEPHPIVAIVGDGAHRYAVSITGRVVGLGDANATTERIDVRDSALSAFVDARGTLFIGGVGFIVERRTEGFVRVFATGLEEGDRPPIGHYPMPTSPAWDASIAGFASIAGRVHAVTLGGSWLVRTDAGFVPAEVPPLDLRAATDDDYSSPSICAVLSPRPDRVVLVSCDGAAYAALSGDTYTVEPTPGHVRVRSASCIAGDACYFIHERGVFRVDATTL